MPVTEFMSKKDVRSAAPSVALTKPYDRVPIRSGSVADTTNKVTILFGQNLIALNQGNIALGDTVTISSKQTPPRFKQPQPILIQEIFLLNTNKTLETNFYQKLKSF